MKVKTPSRMVIVLSLTSAFVAAVSASVLISIFEKKIEAKHTYRPLADLSEDTEDPSLWGRNFPDQFEAYSKTVDQIQTRHGGSEAVHRLATSKDPRTQVSQSKIDEDPRLKTIWAGYAFAHDFREERGHAYMLEDQVHTQRQTIVKQPGTCINCHGSTVKAMRELGNGDLKAGFHKLNGMPYAEAKSHVKFAVSCIDCHEPKSMHLRVTRPAFMEGIKVYQASLGVKNYDVNRDATPQQMRTYVCAQCHVEYYFKGKEKTLTYPWSNGLKADQILAYYDQVQFKDWEHAKTGAPTLKAQHPEFEMYSQGIHARSGVSCVDCHMPYQKVGASKITDHHVQSPLLNLGRACLTCHKFSETEMRARVETIQERHLFLRNIAMDSVVDLIEDIALLGTKDKNAKTEKARDFQRKAQFLLDFAEAENSSGFHAPQESARILGLAIDYARKGQNALKH